MRASTIMWTGRKLLFYPSPSQGIMWFLLGRGEVPWVVRSLMLLALVKGGVFRGFLGLKRKVLDSLNELDYLFILLWLSQYGTLVNGIYNYD